MFIPGETIAHTFYLPFERASVRIIKVTYKQNNDIILVKNVYPGQITDSDLAGLGSKFTVVLSQEESLMFKDDSIFYVQLNTLFADGARGSSVELKGTNGVQHYKEVVSSDA